MTVEASPLGVKCNLRCTYCYENPMRDNQQYPKPDYDKIMNRLLSHNQNFTVFGGEPLLVPVPELERIWKEGFDKYGTNGCQTNGSLITARHMDLFRKYNVHVGFSIDGPGELNDARQAPSGALEATRALTKRSCLALENCLADEQIRCSLIITLHRMNAYGSRLTKLVAWLNRLAKLGLKSIRVHLLEDNDAKDLLLTPFQLLDVVKELENIPMEFDIIKETLQQLREGKGGSCVYHGCDPMSTQAVQSVGPQGEMLNCGRVNKEGIDYLKASRAEPTRSIVLRNTPQSEGGCKDCEYWYACSGNCPGTSIGGDWRNRTEYCAFLKLLFGYFKEKYDIELLENPKGCNVGGHIDSEHQDTHGDSYIDSAHADGFVHTDRAHGDTQHIDRIMLPHLEVRR